MHRHFWRAISCGFVAQILRFLHPKVRMLQGSRIGRSLLGKPFTFDLLASTNSERLSHDNPLARHSPHDSGSMLQKTTFMITTTANTTLLTAMSEQQTPSTHLYSRACAHRPRKTMRVEAPCSSSPNKKRSASSDTAHTPRSQRPHSSCRL